MHTAFPVVSSDKLLGEHFDCFFKAHTIQRPATGSEYRNDSHSPGVAAELTTKPRPCSSPLRKNAEERISEVLKLRYLLASELGEAV